jgi:dihydroorotate dehydrogenase electron transfer subunit
MIKTAAAIINKYIPGKKIQISTERYMKCGIGLCGSCVLDNTGQRVCIEGPIFDFITLKKSREFASYQRDSYGIISE